MFMTRLFNIALIVLMVAGVGIVYDMKYEAALAERELKDLIDQVEEERSEILHLRAEWAALNRPERLERLAETNQDIFQLGEIRVDQITDPDVLNTRLSEWAEPEEERVVPLDAVDPIALLAQQAGIGGN